MDATFWQHAEELRSVLVRVLVVIGIGIAISLFFYQEVFQFLTSPLKEKSSGLERQEVQQERIYNNSKNAFLYSLKDNEKVVGLPSADSAVGNLIQIAPQSSLLIEKQSEFKKLVLLGPIEGMATTLKVSFWLGLVATSPLWLFLILQFIAAALEKHQKKALFPFLGLSLLFMGFGMTFAFFCTIPIANQYLLQFNQSLGTNFWTLSNYLDYTVLLLLANGLAFEFAVILLFLVHFGMISPTSMAGKRRHMIVGAFVLGALLTPPDILTQMMLAIPLIILYEMIIWYGQLRKWIFISDSTD